MLRVNEYGFGRRIPNLGQIGSSAEVANETASPAVEGELRRQGPAVARHVNEARGGGVLQILARRSEGDTLRDLFNAAVRGDVVDLSPDELGKLQRIALNTIQRLFTNQFGSDGELKHQVGLKQAALQKYDVPRDVEDQVMQGRDERNRQLDALNFVLRTFLGTDAGDQALRAAAMDKLKEWGRQRDIQAILPHVRKGPASDLYHGFEAIYGITSRVGSPQKRDQAALAHDPEIGPLLQKSELTHDEKMKVIEAVLQQGEIIQMWKIKGDDNVNHVYGVKFAQTIPGPNGKRENILGIFKPEKIWMGKERAYFTREVAAYQFDKRFTKTSLIPPTVEALIAVPGERGARLGSMQYWVPGAKPLGWPAGNWTWRYDPAFDQLRASDGFERAMAKVRTLLYILDDPDKLPSRAKGEPNLGNFMVDRDYHLWLIDNALGQSEAHVDRGILPDRTESDLFDNMKGVAPQDVADLMDEYVQDWDAQRSGKRFETAKRELENRPKR